MAGATLLRGRRMRVTRLDECGRPIEGPCSQLVTSGFITASISPEVATGDSIEVRNAAGELCCESRSCDELTRNQISLTLCESDAQLLSILTGTEVEVDHAGEVVGYRQAIGKVCHPVAIELWTDLCDSGDGCDGSSGPSAGYILLPRVDGLLVTGGLTIENAALNLELSGGFTKGGAGWGQGPYNVVPQNAANTPGPLLTPLGADDHMLLRTTTVAAPEPTDGCVALTIDETVDVTFTVDGSDDLEAATNPLPNPQALLTIDAADSANAITVGRAVTQVYCSGGRELIGVIDLLAGTSTAEGFTIDSVTPTPALTAGTMVLAAAGSGTVAVDLGPLAKPDDCAQLRLVTTITYTDATTGDSGTEATEAYITFPQAS